MRWTDFGSEFWTRATFAHLNHFFLPFDANWGKELKIAHLIIFIVRRPRKIRQTFNHSIKHHAMHPRKLQLAHKWSHLIFFTPLRTKKHLNCRQCRLDIFINFFFQRFASLLFLSLWDRGKFFPLYCMLGFFYYISDI